jgi:hypothetical protein
MAIWNKSQTGRPDLTETVRSSVDLIASRIDNCEDGLSGAESLDSIVIEGGSIDGTPIGLTTPSSGDFTEITASSADVVAITASSVTSFNWSADTYTINQVYSAVADCIVHVSVGADTGAGSIILATGASNPPTEYTIAQYVPAGATSSCSIAVKKDDNWKVTYSTGSVSNNIKVMYK